MTRQGLQANGEHHAPCARHCEANAFYIEIRALSAELERLRKDAKRMKEGLDAVEVLIDNSSGVAGLHQNGDVASWRELRTGGRFEAWLLAFDEARDVAMKGTP